MRPNRIGAWPLAINNLGTSTIQSSTVDLNAVLDTENKREAIRTSIQVIELFGSPAIGYHDTILCQKYVWHSGDTIALSRTAPRISFGAFVIAPSLRSINADPQPLYCRFVGHALVEGPQTYPLGVEPVLGLKKNADPVGLNPITEGDSRALQGYQSIPCRSRSFEPSSSAGSTDTPAIISAYCDETFMLAKTYNEATGVGFDGNTIFGAGWSVYNSARRTIGGQSPTTVNVSGYSEFFLSVWLYTADMDMFDPNKS